jgi:hypothetical protein
MDPTQIKTRDYALVKIILGATKAGTHVDRVKERRKRKCRGRVRLDSGSEHW